MTHSIIKKSQLEGALRLDAEYYQPGYLNSLQQLKKIPTIKLKDISFVTDGEHGSPIFDENSGIKYFSAQHVKDMTIEYENANTISKIIDEKNKRSSLKRRRKKLNSSFVLYVKSTFIEVNRSSDSFRMGLRGHKNRRDIPDIRTHHCRIRAGYER